MAQVDWNEASAGLRAGAPVLPTVVPLTDAPLIAVDASQGNVFDVTLGGNRTLGNPWNPAEGRRSPSG